MIVWVAAATSYIQPMLTTHPVTIGSGVATLTTLLNYHIQIGYLLVYALNLILLYKNWSGI